MLPDTISVLLVNEQAEEVKLITKALRSFYPGCRVEAVYSSEEAMEWAAKQDWQIILLDESLLDPHVLETLQEVRRHAPRSAVIVATVHPDPAAAIELMRHGADYSILKNMPAFLTDLPIVTREVLEKRELRARLELAQDRHLRLIENLTDIAYELDAEGRFVYISPAIRSLLHYDPQELIGLHYSTLIPPEDTESASRRFNERRSEGRATRRYKLRLRDKDPHVSPLPVEINATALYNRHRQFVGTIGLVRPAVDRRHLHALERLTELPPALTLILSNAERLLQTVHELCKQVGLPPVAEIDKPTSIVETPSEQSGADAGASVPAARPSFQERRQFPRIETRMDARVTSNGSTWQGTALNISLDGIFILLKGEVTASERQQARLGFRSEIGILEIRGTVQDIRATPSHPPGATTRFTGLAIRFAGLNEVEAKILHSLIEALRTGSIVMTCTILLIRQAPDSGLEVSSDAATPQAKAYPGVSADRRQATRVNLGISVQMQFPSLPGSSPQDAALTNLSAGGGCVQLQSFRSTSELVGQRVTLRFSPPPDIPPQSALDRPESEYRLTGEVVWAIHDETQEAALRLGLRFIHDHDSDTGLTILLRRYLTSDRVRRSDEPAPIATDFLQCTNARGQRIALSHDHQPTLPVTAPVVIVAPGYGRTKIDYIELAYYFASNGYRVLRYDHSCHVGESDGGIVLTTLTNMQEDLNAVMEYAVRLWPGSPLVVMAGDIAARVALKTLRRSPTLRLLVLLAPVLDIQYTLMAVHQDDLIRTSLQGVKRGISNILGFNIDADTWLSDAIEGAYADFQTTLDDLAEIRIPLLVFSSEQDLWTRPHSHSAVKAALGDIALVWQTMPEARHGLTDHPIQARPVYRQMVAHCRRRLSPLAAEDVTAPTAHDLDHQTQLERERARLHHQMDQPAAVEFWREYLDRSHALANFSEYWHLLDRIHRLLGPFDTNIRLLDAGCGNGNFGMFLLIAASFRPAQLFGPESRLHYVGVDLVPSGLEQAKTNLIRVAAELRGKFAGSVRPQSVMKASLACLDLNASLPFQDGQFDRVVCNLVLGYLRDPLFTLRELVRVLAPHGKLVLTHFKPQADVARLNGESVSAVKGDVDTGPVKQPEDASDRIIPSCRETSFHFFDRQELAMLLVSSGASQPRIYSAFANQAYIAVAEKSSTPPVQEV